MVLEVFGRDGWRWGKRMYVVTGIHWRMELVGRSRCVREMLVM